MILVIIFHVIAVETLFTHMLSGVGTLVEVIRIVLHITIGN